MKSNDIFGFSFVNRYHEREQLTSFLYNVNNANVLWMHGKRGTGKTRLAKYVAEKTWNSSDSLTVYVDAVNEDSEQNMLLELLRQLQKYNHIGMLKYAFNHYKSFKDIVDHTVYLISKEKISDLTKLTNYLFNDSYLIMKKRRKEERQSSDLVISYIREILQKKKIFLVLDNFIKYDIKSFNAILEILNMIIVNPRIKCCVITTEEDLEIYQNRYNDMLNGLPLQHLKVSEFDSSQYFSEILSQNFRVNNILPSDFEMIFNCCKGSPQQLVALLQKLFSENGIALRDTGKAVLNKEIIFKILLEGELDLLKKDFSIRERYILYIVLSFGKKISIEFLYKISEYLSKKVSLVERYLAKDMVNDTLNVLIGRNILQINIDNKTIKFAHDKTYNDVLLIFKDEGMYPLISKTLYEYLAQNETEFFTYGFNERDMRELKALYSYSAKLPGWIKDNYVYGTILFKLKLYQEATYIFLRLSDSLFHVIPIHQLRIAISSYEVGNYKYSKRCLLNIKIDDIKILKIRYIFYFYYAKTIYNLEGDTLQAIDFLKKALRCTRSNLMDKITALNLLSLYYWETEDGQDYAKKIFFKIKDTYYISCPTGWAKTIRGCQNFIKGNSAIRLLNQAEEIINNEIEKAYIWTTKGFIYVVSNDLYLAEENFQHSYDYLCKLRIHDSSYALNNLAVLKMINGNYNSALKDLLVAFRWNVTDYADITIRVHLAICYTYLNMVTEANENLQFLVNYTDNRELIDGTVIRKVYINLGKCFQILNRPIEGQKYLEKALPYSIGTSSEYRLNRMLGREVSYHPTPRYEKCVDFDPWFLVYAHD
jgi:tetratricopeptide (TPR) repeat protein